MTESKKKSDFNWTEKELEEFHYHHIISTLDWYEELSEEGKKEVKNISETLKSANKYVAVYENSVLKDVERYSHLEKIKKEARNKGIIITYHPINYQSFERFKIENIRYYRSHKTEIKGLMEYEDENYFDVIIGNVFS